MLSLLSHHICITIPSTSSQGLKMSQCSQKVSKYFRQALTLISPPLDDSMTPSIISVIRRRTWFTTFMVDISVNVLFMRSSQKSIGRHSSTITKLPMACRKTKTVCINGGSIICLFKRQFVVSFSTLSSLSMSGQGFKIGAG